MCYEVTATRMRPQNFNQLKGQEFVVSTIQSAIDNNKIAHAYLFSGPRGTGKTTSARLLSKALNCVNGPTSTPCGECDKCVEIAEGTCTDVIEIDGASNNSVNDIKNIQEELMFQPANARYKIYIIDEVHMLSINAFNALLKTIEEPPQYAIFIFATTETHKVPATIKSRCQQFNFQLFDLKTIQHLLQKVCEDKHIKYEDKALTWIAKEATGSMRDAYTLFDQVVSFSNNDITLSKIEKTLGIVEQQVIQELVSYMIQKNRKEALLLTQSILIKGSSVGQVIKSLANYFKSLIMIHSNILEEDLLYGSLSNYPIELRRQLDIFKCQAALDLILNLHRNIRYSLNPRIELELAISKLCSISNFVSTTSLLEEIRNTKKTFTVSENDIYINSSASPTQRPEIKEASSKELKIKNTNNFKQENIKTFISSIDSASLQAALNKSKITLTNENLIIDVSSSFNYNRIEKDESNLNMRLKEFGCNVPIYIKKEKQANMAINENIIKKTNDQVVDALVSTFDGKIIKD